MESRDGEMNGVLIEKSRKNRLEKQTNIRTKATKAERYRNMAFGEKKGALRLRKTGCIVAGYRRAKWLRGGQNRWE